MAVGLLPLVSGSAMEGELMPAPTVTRLLSRRRPLGTTDLCPVYHAARETAVSISTHDNDVPTQDVALSVSKQSVVSSDLSHRSTTLELARRNQRGPQNCLWVTTQSQTLSRQIREQIGQVDFESTSGSQS
jgi:hypothetical protein